MKTIIRLSIIACGVFISACGSNQDANKASGVGISVDEKTATMDKEASAEKSYPVALVNNKKDPTCGMPVTAGISDTLHYKEYVLGFCSEGCKDEAKQALLKNPKALLDSARATLPSGK